MKIDLELTPGVRLCLLYQKFSELISMNSNFYSSFCFHMVKHNYPGLDGAVWKSGKFYIGQFKKLQEGC